MENLLAIIAVACIAFVYAAVVLTPKRPKPRVMDFYCLAKDILEWRRLDREDKIKADAIAYFRGGRV